MIATFGIDARVMRMSSQCFALIAMVFGADAKAAPPQLYHQPAYQSPVRGQPDDLLMLAGYGLAAGDTVVYRAVATGNDTPHNTEEMPKRSDADSGLAPIVSARDAPYSLTIKLPLVMRADQTYELKVRSAAGEWSQAVKINDARPLWASPAAVYATAAIAALPRELKIVGRNLQAAPGNLTQIRLLGPQQLSGNAITDSLASPAVNHYVARLKLPERIAPGAYRIQLKRESNDWIELGQSLEVLPDPERAAEFSVGEPRFGGCRPDDGADDTNCILRAIDAAGKTKAGTVYFGPGTWDISESDVPGVALGDGIIVSPGVRLRGAGAGSTKIVRHAEWSKLRPTTAFTLAGANDVSGFTFRDLQVYGPSDSARAFLQIGESLENVSAAHDVRARLPYVDQVFITHNIFDKPFIAIESGGLPIKRLLITYNTFGAYYAALELNVNRVYSPVPFRIDDSVIDYNIFKPGSKLDSAHKTGALASELGAGTRVDFSGNIADGSSTAFLNTPFDSKGWRAAFFWNLNNNAEEVLVSQNTAICTGDKTGDGEAIAFDNNGNTFGFQSASTVTEATSSSIAVSSALAAHQNGQAVLSETYYADHWVQVLGGPGLGQTRKIVGYSTDPLTHLTTIKVSPDWDVVPIANQSRVAVGREFWQLYALDNHIDNRRPLCNKSNPGRNSTGVIVMWAQSADSVIEGNRQYDSSGIFVQQAYLTPEHQCSDCTMQSYFQSFLEIRDNLIDGEYDWNLDCSASGIALGVAVAPWVDAPPPTVGYGVSISHNTIRHADALRGGAISQMNSGNVGPEPHRWQFSDNVLIHHNSILDIEGSRATPKCEAGRPRVGIAFPEPPIAWRTVLYANSCRNVSVPVGSGGVDMSSVCPSSVPDSCECARYKR